MYVISCSHCGFKTDINPNNVNYFAIPCPKCCKPVFLNSLKSDISDEKNAKNSLKNSSYDSYGTIKTLAGSKIDFALEKIRKRTKVTVRMWLKPPDQEWAIWDSTYGKTDNFLNEGADGLPHPRLQKWISYIQYVF